MYVHRVCAAILFVYVEAHTNAIAHQIIPTLIATSYMFFKTCTVDREIFAGINFRLFNVRLV